MAASLEKGNPLSLQPGSPANHQAGGIDIRGHVGDHPLDGLELGDRLVELLALLGISHRPVEGTLRQPHRHGRDRQATGIQRGQELFEALVLLSEQVGGGNAAVLEEQLRSHRSFQPHLLFIASHLKTGSPFFDDERGDAASAFIRVRLGGNHQHISKGTVGDELFLPVDDPLIPVADGAGAGGPGIRSGLRFGQPKCADLFAAQPGAGRYFFFWSSVPKR